MLSRKQYWSQAAAIAVCPTIEQTEIYSTDVRSQYATLLQKKARKSIQGAHIVIVLWALWCLVLLLLVRVFGLVGRELVMGGLAGLVWGVASSGMYYLNKRWKVERNQRVRGNFDSSTTPMLFFPWNLQCCT